MRFASRSGAVSHSRMTQHLRANIGQEASVRNKTGDTGKMDKDKQQDAGIFDAAAVLNNIRASRTLIRRQRYTKSKLDHYRAELVALRIAGASLSDLVFWLRKEKRMKAQRTTVQRYLDKLPEMRMKMIQSRIVKISKLKVSDAKFQIRKSTSWLCCVGKPRAGAVQARQ